MLTAEDTRAFLIASVLLVLVVCCWAAGFLFAPVDANQGEVYRIIFIHVPCAITAFACSASLLVTSIRGLAKRSESALRWSKAWSEVGLLYTCLALMSGSVWGKPTWGTWWTWDARLTTTFILALLYAGWLLLHSSLAAGPGRIRACAVLGILIAIDVPIIYKSVEWWRTLHQPPSMMRTGGASMDPDILHTLLSSILVMIAYACALAALRRRNLELRDEVESASFDQLAR